MLQKLLLKLLNLFYPHIIQRYVLRLFFLTFFVCIFIAITLFLVIDIFENSNKLIKANSGFWISFQYFLYKIPMVLHLMTPVAMLIATLISIGRLSQLSEITAMRACGLSVFNLVRPLLVFGFITVGVMFVFGETIVPLSADKVQQINNIDIKKKDLKGAFNKTNFWYRDDDKILNIGFYNSKIKRVNGLSIFNFDNEGKLVKKTDADQAIWNSQSNKWIMGNVTENKFSNYRLESVSKNSNIILDIKETPEDFYNLQKLPETMSYRELGKYIEKLKREGVPTREYKIKQISKVSFLLINVLLILIAFPFGLLPARSGSLLISLVAGLAIGFGYYVIHALLMAFGTAELLPIYVSAWSTNVLFLIVAGYYLIKSDYA